MNCDDHSESSHHYRRSSLIFDGKRQTARKLFAGGPFGGLVGIYQEVVTLSIPTRGFSTMATSANSGS